MAIHIQEFRKLAAKFTVKDGVPDDLEERLKFLEVSREAQCFDFGDRPKLIVPDPDDVKELRSFPFPAPVCWYEYL